jgi:hypothetical protein
MRRRARFLRKARELAYRDLGGLVFNLHRFGERNDALVLTKLNTLGHIDAELRTLETALGERDPVTVLREAGVTACPRCAAIHSGDDHFCPNCGLSMGRHIELPIAGTPAGVAPTPAREQAAPAPAATPGAEAAPATPGAASTPPTPPSTRGSTPSPPPSPPAAEPDGPRSPSPKTGRSPTPPTGRTPAAPAAEEPAESSVEDTQTEILHPLERDK